MYYELNDVSFFIAYFFFPFFILYIANFVTGEYSAQPEN